MINKKYLVLIITILFLVMNFSISVQAVDTAVTIVPQKQFVKAVAGDDSEVTVMIPPGYSPGNYAPRPSELTKFSDAKIYFSMGVPADVQNILPKVEQFNSEIKVVKLAELVGQKYEDRTFENGSRDPHIWLSPKRVKYIIEIIRGELSKLVPDNEELYHDNAEEYIEKINETDQRVQEIINQKDNNYMLVYHPSFGYFAEHYGLNMISIEKGGKEATAKHLEDIIDFAKENDIKRIFYQAEIDSRQTEALAEEINAELIKLDPLAEDYLANLIEMAKKISGVD